MGGDQKTASEDIKHQDKKKPIRMEVHRDPMTREITGLTPIYEEIKKEADPGTDLSSVAESLLGDDAGGDGNE